MAHVLFDQGKKVGEISDWVEQSTEPEYKTFLGKTVLSAPAKRECSFVSPKPVNRKSELFLVVDKKRRLNLQIKSVKGTTVTAVIVSEEDV